MRYRAVIFDMYETLVTQLRSPLYYGTQMAQDMGLAPEVFLPGWRKTEEVRATGRATFEEVVEKLMGEHGVYTPELYHKVVNRRLAVQADCFMHLHPQILPMLSGLQEQGLKIGLITNCFSEESKLIRESALFPYFDAPCMSWEMGVRKPDPAIYRACLAQLGLSAEECLYVGDGGSNELEASGALGMQAVQAVWCRQEGFENHQTAIRPEFRQIAEPMQIVYEAQVASR